MTALLWKDYRLNRLLLAFGLLMLAIPYLVGIPRNLYAGWRWGENWWTDEFWWVVGMISLVLSQFTAAMLGGNAVASERADRSAEFLAYLPASRKAIIGSKAILAFAALAVIWGVNLVVMLVVSPAFRPAHIAPIRGADEIAQILTMVAGFCILLFGSGWFWSCVMSSHGLATGMAVAVLAFLGCGMASLEFLFELTEFVERWFAPISISIGTIGFVAGTAYYLWRVEP